jgi:hypothetical protein
MELKLTQKMVDDLVHGYNNGKTTIELAELYNLSIPTVCRGLRKGGVDPERKDDFFAETAYSKEDRDGILADFKSGIGIAELMTKYSTGHAKLINLLEIEGLYKKKSYNPETTKVIKIGDNIRRILNQEEQIQLCEQFVDGPLTRQELAQEWGIHVDTVSATLRRHDTTTKRYVPEEIIDAFCKEFQDRISNLYEISKLYDLDPSTVKYWLTKRGVLDTSREEAREASAKKILTHAEFRRMAAQHDLEMLEAVLDIVRNPQTDKRTKLSAALAIIEIRHGKPKEAAPEEEEEKKTAADKILGLVTKDLFKKN